jgi:hypothetical protein
LPEEWTPIRRSGHSIRGPDREEPGLLVVDLRLNKEPPAEWASFFARPVGVSTSSSIHPPSLVGSAVKITAPDAQLEEYVRHVDQRIAAANAYYESEILPAITTEQAVRKAEREDARTRIENAERRLDNL